MSKSQVKDLLLGKLDANKIITSNQIEDVKNNSNINNIEKIIEEILEEDFIFKPIPIPNDYNTSIIYILR